MDEARAHRIIGRALYETITRLRQLPDEQRPQSDIDDMHELLEEQYAGVRASLVSGAADVPFPAPVVTMLPTAAGGVES